MNQHGIHGLDYTQASSFVAAAQHVARCRYREIPERLAEKLQALRVSAEAFERVADDVEALLADDVASADGEYYETPIVWMDEEPERAA
jgi:transcription initiation factor TFIIIB Brf1 subunit/transcription initiation factor TFIIB